MNRLYQSAAVQGLRDGSFETMKVRELLQREPPVTIKATDTWELARQVMGWSGIRHLPVMRGRELVGVITERDLFHHAQDPRQPVENVMSVPAHTVAADAELADAEFLMASEKVGCLPVLDRGQLVGLLTTTDLLEFHGGRS